MSLLGLAYQLSTLASAAQTLKTVATAAQVMNTQATQSVVSAGTKVAATNVDDLTAMAATLRENAAAQVPEVEKVAPRVAPARKAD